VAINNRRANAGDYLWVISLRDGKPIKMPDDVAEDVGKKEAGRIAGDHWSDQSISETITLSRHARTTIYCTLSYFLPVGQARVRLDRGKQSLPVK